MSQNGNRVVLRSRPTLRSAFGLLLAGVVLVAPSPAQAAGDVEFNRDVRPILRETCFVCHGPDSGSRKADLRLDKREAAIEAGALKPGNAEESEMILRVLSEDPEEVMPPPEAKKPLTAEQKDILKRWVASGAEYQPHWAFIAPVRPEPPAVQDAGWVKNPIDRFLLAKMEEKGLTPSPEANRRVLARRASLDLTGLPPTPPVVEAFVNDDSPDAYEKYVDRLLESPDWGEHRARYWLDAARYGDTHGIHIDNYREIWSYRDWVIKAFNANMPFDQFTVEQLAGDLLPDRSLDQQIASGFNRCNITTSEGGAIDEEYLVLYARDRTETVSQTFMGLTTGCAVCHDHKFDPISQREFYELSAFFNNTTQRAMDGNVKDTPPIVFVPEESDRARWSVLVGEVETAKKALDSRREAARPEFDKWFATQTPASISGFIPTDGLKLRARLDDRDSAAKKTASEGIELADVGDFEKDQAFSYGTWIRPTKTLDGAILSRMDDADNYRGWDLWLEGGKVGSHIISKWEGDALKVVSDGTLKPNEWNHVLVTYDGSGKASGIQIYVDGKLRSSAIAADTLKGSIRTKVPFKIGQRSNSSRVEDAAFHDLRVYARALSAEDVAQLYGASQAFDLASKPLDQRTPTEVDPVFTWYFASQVAESKELTGKLTALEQEQAALKARGTIAHVMNEKPEPAMAFILSRGDYDKRREPVSADTPDILPPMASDLPKNRLGLAQWLVRPEHPLTSRVTVNRFWQEVFGTGLVKTTGDFGLSGELPSHPELLDWLALEFRDKGWDVKAFYRLLVTSAAYRQSAAATPDQIEKDPANRYLARGPRFRMDAEMIRDYALAVSGELVKQIGGPSVRPYQPEGVWEAVAMPGSDTRNYVQDHGDKLYRRSMYTFLKRAAPPASMDIFNAPAREVCTVRRERTNTPLQALVTLNDTQFVEAARNLAQIVLKEGGETVEGRIDLAARRLLARPMTPEEVKVVRESFDALHDFYKSHPEDATKLIQVGESKADPSLAAPELAAWTMLANELMNLDEVLNK
ncbi:DUF1553 domain-containing protein [Tundrisphaera lichenicola]|uniref:DUF1553 domain-containing protein n=1 Tax=Tundrisphaera lichenicola TaxID=2029860 RepID=UPI003EB804CE